MIWPVGLVVGLYCRAGAGPFHFSGNTVLVMFRAGSGSIPAIIIKLAQRKYGPMTKTVIPALGR